MRKRYIFRGGRWVEYEKRPRDSRVHVIADTVDKPFKSMADGKTYDSKSRYRAEAKARGYIEVGNERVEPETYEPPSAIPDLQRAFEEHS